MKILLTFHRGFALPQEEIESIAKRYIDATRDGARDLFELLYRQNVPILVFSAGLGNAVKAMLKNFNMLLPNVKVCVLVTKIFRLIFHSNL